MLISAASAHFEVLSFAKNAAGIRAFLDSADWFSIEEGALLRQRFSDIRAQESAKIVALGVQFERTNMVALTESLAWMEMNHVDPSTKLRDCCPAVGILSLAQWRSASLCEPGTLDDDDDNDDYDR